MARPQLLLTLAVLAALGPFVTKPFNIDEPLFLWAARQIQAHPANPYGFDVNWYGAWAHMWEVTKNPPLASYFLALAAAVLGWSEIALHSACLLPAVAAILGTFRLARHLCGQPLLAACATLFTPVYLVSSTAVMCDTLLVAFWVWAVVLWVEGIEDGSPWRLAGSALLIALAALSKYFGIALIPLLFLYGLVRTRRLGLWAGFLFIPAAILAGYQWATYALYGNGLLSDAGEYAVATRTRSWASMLSAAMTALAFTGGCFAVATLVIAWLWRPRVLAAFLLLGVLVGIALLEGQTMPQMDGPSQRLLQSQLLVWIIGGAGILSAAVAAWRWRDPGSTLLVLWIGGTFFFASFVNWTVNARSVLPMAPAVGILVARRLSETRAEDHPLRRWGVRLSLVAGAALALLVARGDFLLAKAVRESARQTYARLAPGQETLWFGGHWGFQYYLEGLGKNAKPAVNGRLRPKPGDLLANALNNCKIRAPRRAQYNAVEEFSVQGPRWVTTMNGEVGAGFYVDSWGPMPFSFAKVPPERIRIYHLVPTADITLVTSDRADLDCASEQSIQGFRCGFADEIARSEVEERSKLQPVYTLGRHLYLVPGLFLEPAIGARYQAELPNKPREQLKRFTADCQLRVIGKLAGVRTRFDSDGAWTDPQEVEVGAISNCRIDG